MTATGDNPNAFPGEGTLPVFIQVLSASNGDKIEPKFDFWMHHDDQVKRADSAPGLEVSATMNLNAQLVQGGITSANYINNFNFSTGNNNALDKDAGAQYGALQPLGINVQMRNPSGNGMVGCATPTEPISIDLNFRVTYTVKSTGERIDLTALGYSPYIWLYDKNRTAAESSCDGRMMAGLGGGYYNTVNTEIEERGPSILDSRAMVPDEPWKTMSISGKTTTVWNGGTWTAVKNGTGSYTFTVSDYAVNPNWFPNYSGQSGDGKQIWNLGLGVRNCSIGNFATCEIWVLLPYTFVDKNGNTIDLADEYNAGNINLYAYEGSNLNVGTSAPRYLTYGDDTLQQVVGTGTEDFKTVSREIGNPGGRYTAHVRYAQGTGASNYDTRGVNDLVNGWDTASIGQRIRMIWGTQEYDNGYIDNALIAVDSLLMFNSDAIELVSPPSTYGGFKYLYGAVKAHPTTDWVDDNEMNSAGYSSLIWFSSYAELVSTTDENGKPYVCSGVLAEARWNAPTVPQQSPQHTLMISAKVRDDVVDGVSAYDRLADNVYQIRAYHRYWNVATGLTKDDIPSYLAVQNDGATWPSGGGSLVNRSYTKTTYENGVATHNHVGRDYGDSLYVMTYQAKIAKALLQTAANASGSQQIKTSFDLDHNERYVDYSITPSLTTASTVAVGMKTTVTITDILQNEHLHYVPDSAYWGGTYTQAGPGKQGTVEGGTPIVPQSVTIDPDTGYTTIVWVLNDVETGKPIDPIYYTCELGEPGSENDVPNGASLTNEANINTTEDRRAWNVLDGNRARKTVTVSRTSMSALAKTADAKFIEKDGKPAWRLSAANNADSDIENTLFLDVLPANGVAGSSFKSEAVLNIDEWTLFGMDNLESWKVYYTTDTAVQGTDAKDYINADGAVQAFPDGEKYDVANSIAWTPATITVADGVATIDFGDAVPTGVAFLGTVKAEQNFRSHVVLDPSVDLDPEDKLVNHLSQGLNTVNSAVRVVNRIVEGLVWFDKDHDGQRDHSETNAEPLIPGVAVNLLRLDEESGDYVSVATMKTDANGAYHFEGMYAGTYKVEFTKGDYASFPLLRATAKNVGDDLYDSDATGIVEDGELKSGVIESLELPTIKQMGSYRYTTGANDMGLIDQRIDIPVNKVWVDDNNRDGKQPEGVQVQLKANGTASGSPVTLNEGNEWTYTYSKLPVYQNTAAEDQPPAYAAGAQPITYTVDEVKTAVITGTDGPGTYAYAIEGSAAAGFTVTNTHTPETIDIPVEKKWEGDAAVKDVMRPQSVTVQLLVDDEPVAGVEDLTLSDSNQWKDTFEGLYKYENGEEIEYDVSEVEVDGYDTQVTKAATGYNVTITNTLKTTDITLDKTWDDLGNVMGDR
ncbi:MAG: Cna B-type domain-containing protein, partial [Atopobiaceae bacterium]|nr:Cna B-type domain-containing protein [Atopobiaceae bacterium]